MMRGSSLWQRAGNMKEPDFWGMPPWVFLGLTSVIVLLVTAWLVTKALDWLARW